MATGSLSPTDVAIVGIAGRYSGAQSPDELWTALVEGRELNHDGPSTSDPTHVARYSAISDVEYFDHEFFGFTPYEATMTDPQHRLLLECSFRALEDAGYADHRPRRFGVFASGSLSTYLINNIVANGRYRYGAPNFTTLIGNDKDMLASRVAYKLNLTGPALSIQTACSSSLVALNSACLSLLGRECDGALVAAASLTIPAEVGYHYEEGGILSRDGYCRAFDASSSGTVKGNGCSVVVLKRAADALRDGDRIYALVRGTAVNNDGSAKVGYTAPSVSGQVDVIQNCLAFADLRPDDIDCIEAHATGTQLGDPIELAALAKVFRRPNRRLPVGSIKANIGHLDAAAGLTSVIKGVFMLETGLVPGNIHLVNLNPKIDNTAHLFSFPRHTEQHSLKTIGVSSFGIGGTNAHAVLARAPELDDDVRRAGELPLYLLPFSYLRAEDEATHRRQLLDGLTTDSRLCDVAFTLSTGRRRWQNCRYRAVASSAELVDVLSGSPGSALPSHRTLTSLLRELQAPDYASLVVTVPAYFLCWQGIRCDGALADDQLDEARAALILLLRYLEAINGPEAAGLPGPKAAAEAVYQRSEVLPDGSRRLADDGCVDFSPVPTSRSRGRIALRSVYGFLAAVGDRRVLNLRSLYAGLGARRLPLPGVPMSKSRHWIDAPGPQRSPAPAGDASKTDSHSSATLASQVIDLIAQGVGVASVQASDNFYDVGGDSLLGVTIVGELNDRFGTSLTLDEFMSCSTIGEVADLVCARVPDASGQQVSGASGVQAVGAPLAPFMKMIRGGGGPIVFAVHPAGGTTFCYRVLNRALSNPCTLIGLDLPDRYAEMDAMGSLARFYADALQEVQPRDRIALCGYSFGGNLAVEIGKALVSDGRQVGRLLMIDALPPEAYARPVPSPEEQQRMLPGVITAYLRARGHGGTDLESVPGVPDGERPLAASAALLGLSVKETSQFVDAWFYHYRLLHRPAEPGVFPGAALVLRADTALDPTLAGTLHLDPVPMELWRSRFSGSVEVVSVPGDHLSCMADPLGVKAVGVEFERWLARLDDTHHAEVVAP